ncbi:MAG: DUF481 domain-containing protein [Planctomycetota bacterium]
MPGAEAANHSAMGPVPSSSFAAIPPVSNSGASQDAFELPAGNYVDVAPVAYQGSGVPPAPVVDPAMAAAAPPTESLPAESPIGRAIEAGVLPPTPPLEEETRRWYTVPLGWIRGWENHAEFGLDGSAGNAETLALQTGLEMRRKTDDYTLSLDVDYRKASSRGVTTEDNGRFNLDYDRLLGDSPWAYFGKFGAEFDQFKPFDARINLNGGVSYHWVRTDDALFVTRFGAGASREIGSPDDDWIPEGVFGLEAERQVNRYNKLKGKVDYFPNWSDFADYRIVTDLAWEILLDDSDNLSLKVAVTDRYDSTPQGARPNDVYYSLLLLVKF